MVAKGLNGEIHDRGFKIKEAAKRWAEWRTPCFKGVSRVEGTPGTTQSGNVALSVTPGWASIWVVLAGASLCSPCRRSVRG